MRGFQTLFANLLMVMLTVSAAEGQSIPSGDPPHNESTSRQRASSYATPAAGKGDWNRVRDLARDEEITVNARGESLHCLFNGATDDALWCQPYYAWGDGREWRIERSDVKSIRLVQAKRNMKLAVGSLAVAGFVWGAVKGSNPSSGYNYPRVVVGLAGAGLGALVGCVAALPAVFIPGRLVYRRESPEHGPESGQMEARQ